VEYRRVATTCLIWPGEEHLVARPVGNAGRSLLLDVAQERKTQSVVVDNTVPHVRRKAMMEVACNGMMRVVGRPYLGVVALGLYDLA
jgi:hypothetical protein